MLQSALFLVKQNCIVRDGSIAFQHNMDNTIDPIPYGISNVRSIAEGMLRFAESAHFKYELNRGRIAFFCKLFGNYQVIESLTVY